MRLTSVDMIDSEMKLARNIYKGSATYLTAGQKDITKYQNQLKKLGVDYIYVEDELSEDIEIPDVVSDETRQKCKVALEGTFTTLAKSGVLDTIRLEPCVASLMDEVMENIDVQISLTDISVADDYTLNHSVSTAVYALVLAEKLGMKKSEVSKLCMGALLHDIGKIMLDKDILFKNGKLTEEEFDYVKQHTTLGYEVLRRSSTITELSKMISITHHERLDGSGYPKGLKGDDIHKFSRIVGIADTYDALTSDRCYREKWPADKACDLLVEKSGTQFDMDMVRAFIQQVAIYPNGSIVKLNNGFKAVVKGQNQGIPQRPILRVFEDNEGNRIEPFIINLLDELSITITESQLEILKKERHMDFGRLR